MQKNKNKIKKEKSVVPTYLVRKKKSCIMFGKLNSCSSP